MLIFLINQPSLVTMLIVTGVNWDDVSEGLYQLQKIFKNSINCYYRSGIILNSTVSTSCRLQAEEKENGIHVINDSNLIYGIWKNPKAFYFFGNMEYATIIYYL